MNFMDSFTLVNMLPQGFKRTLSSHRRFRAQGALRHLMMLAIIVLSMIPSCHAAGLDKKFEPKTWKMWVYLVLAVVAFLAIFVGTFYTADWNGASGFMKTSMIFMGIGVLVGAGSKSFLHYKTTGHGRPSNLDIVEQQAVYKNCQAISQWASVLLVVALIVMAVFAGTADGDEGRMMGKSMVAGTFMTSLFVTSFMIKATYFKSSDASAGTFGANPLGWVANRTKAAASLVVGDKNSKTEDDNVIVVAKPKGFSTFCGSSYTFWLSLIVIIIAGCLLGTDNFEGQSFYKQTAIAFVSGLFVITAFTVGLIRFHYTYKTETNRDEDHSKWKNDASRKEFAAGERWVMMFAYFFVLLWVILLSVDASHFGAIGGNNGMVVCVLMGLVVGGGVGMWYTGIKPVLKHHFPSWFKNCEKPTDNVVGSPTKPLLLRSGVGLGAQQQRRLAALEKLIM